MQLLILRKVEIMKNYYLRFINTPIGELEVLASPKGIVSISHMLEDHQSNKVQDNANPSSIKYVNEAISQLEEYFNGIRTTFDLPLKLEGTVFQKKIWNALLSIPYGETLSYKELAITVGSPKGFRAAGSACGKNPVSIIVPCHRILTSKGGLGGYAGGVDRKKWLLQHESKTAK